MSRRRRLTLIVVAGMALITAILLTALPEVLRRVAEAEVLKRTGRALAIEDVDLNLFRGHLALKKVRLADRDGSEPFVELERFDVRIALPALLVRHLRFREITLTRPSIRVVRTSPTEFNFSDLIRATGEPSPEPDGSEPSRWTVTVDRLIVSEGVVRVDDRAVTPAAQWHVHELGVEGTALTTAAAAPPGQLAVHSKIDDAVLVLTAHPLSLEPLQMSATLFLSDFEMRRLNPYVYIPLGTPYQPKGGLLTLALSAQVDSDEQEVKKAVLAGQVNLAREALVQVGRDDPFLSVTRLGVDIKEADALNRSLTLASVVLEGLDLKARRDRQGVIDLVAMLQPKASSAPRAAAPAKPSTAPAEPVSRRRLFPILRALGREFPKIRIERITLGPSTVAVTDEEVTPTTTLALTNLQVGIDDFTWPVTGPARLALSTGLPGGGTLAINGPVTVEPFDARLTTSVRNAPVEPYQAYIPVPAQLSGRFNGDSTHHIVLRGGTPILASKGHSWGQNVAIRAPGAKQPSIQVERMELQGIDFAWPKRAKVARAGFRRPRVEIQREPDGSIDVRRLFTPPDDETKTPASRPEPTASPGPPRPKSPGPLETMQIAFGEVRVEGGFIRFLDRTTQPAFSQDISRLEVRLTGFSNRPDRRAKLTLQSVVGGDAGLDIRGEVGPLGAPPFVDLVGELRSYPLPSVDPYSEAAIGWVIKKGELQYKLRFTIDGDQINAENDLVVERLQVAPAGGTDDAKKRLALPLGLIVALVKDQQGDIRANVPVTGSVKDPSFQLGNAIWTAVKNVLVNIATAPFKLIGKMISEGEMLEEPKVDPVTFAAGSSVLSPAMEDHLLRVADFLRRAPFVDLAMTSRPSEADVATLKGEAVRARVREFQKARGLEDAGAALAAYYKEHLPEVAMPATVEERLALLREREPASEALLADLGRRRLEATRERLLTAEGIPAKRLKVEPAPPEEAPAPADGEGRVEFGVVAGE
jgi:hypothetical protein